MRKSLGLLIVLIFLSAGSAEGAAPASWELRDGRWQQVAAAAPETQPASEPALDRAEQLVSRKKDQAARKILVRWLKRNRSSPLRDQALFLLAEAYYQYGDRIRSFYYLDELLDRHPESRLYYPALEKQYEIADGYLDGYKRRFLRIPMFRAEEEAVEMLYRIQGRAPGSTLAERSLLRTADYYYADGQFDLAADAYGAYARSYPRSPYVPRVRLRQAYSSYAQFRGVAFDVTPLLDSRAQLVDLAADYPDLAKEEGVPEIIQRIDTDLARKIYHTADFYRRTREPKAAVYHYRFLIKTYPDSPEAGQAQQKLDKMPSWALNTPEPAGGGGYIPGVVPAGAEVR